MLPDLGLSSGKGKNIADVTLQTDTMFIRAVIIFGYPRSEISCTRAESKGPVNLPSASCGFDEFTNFDQQKINEKLTLRFMNSGEIMQSAEMNGIFARLHFQSKAAG